MKIFDRSETRERQVLAAMISSSEFLARVAPTWDGEDLFASRPANVIGKLCLDHYNAHRSAPGSGVRALFSEWAESSRDEDSISLAERMLESTKEFEQNGHTNVGLALDIAANLFTAVRLRKNIQDQEAELNAGRLQKALEKREAFRTPAVGVGDGIDVFNDREELYANLIPETREVLVHYPGAIGQFFGRDFRRGGFVTFFAPEKSCKSLFLLDIAFRAAEQRRRVAYFQVGDLTKQELYERIAVRSSKTPLDPETVKWPTSVKIEDHEAVADHDEMAFDEGITPETVWKSFQKLVSKRIKSKSPYFRLSVHANKSISVDGVRSLLSTWEAGGFTADVVVIDYADILDMPTYNNDFRHATDNTWSKLRTLSQELHCLLVTASQTDAASYETKLLTRSNFSEDKRKHSHITTCIGINISVKEKEQECFRLNHLQRRGEKFNWKRVVAVAGCLALARPIVLSSF